MNPVESLISILLHHLFIISLNFYVFPAFVLTAQSMYRRGERSGVLALARFSEFKFLNFGEALTNQGLSFSSDVNLGGESDYYFL